MPDHKQQDRGPRCHCLATLEPREKGIPPPWQGGVRTNTGTAAHSDISACEHSGLTTVGSQLGIIQGSSIGTDGHSASAEIRIRAGCPHSDSTVRVDGKKTEKESGHSIISSHKVRNGNYPHQNDGDQSNDCIETANYPSLNCTAVGSQTVRVAGPPAVLRPLEPEAGGVKYSAKSDCHECHNFHIHHITSHQHTSNFTTFHIIDDTNISACQAANNGQYKPSLENTSFDYPLGLGAVHVTGPPAAARPLGGEIHYIGDTDTTDDEADGISAHRHRGDHQCMSANEEPPTHSMGLGAVPDTGPPADVQPLGDGGLQNDLQAERTQKDGQCMAQESRGGHFALQGQCSRGRPDDCNGNTDMGHSHSHGHGWSTQCDDKLYIDFINCTSVNQNLQALLDRQSDAVCMAEVSVHSRSIPAKIREIRETKVWEDLVMTGPDPECERVTAGVGAMAKRGTKLVPAKLNTQEAAQADATGRLHIIEIHKNRAQVLVAIAYGWTGGNDDAEAAARTDDLIAAINVEFSTQLQGPKIILGDLNADTARLPTLQWMLQSCHWTDIGAEGRIYGKAKILETCKISAAAKATRIDYAIANDEAIAIITGYEVDYLAPFPSHFPIRLQLHSGPPIRRLRQLRKTTLFAETFEQSVLTLQQHAEESGNTQKEINQIRSDEITKLHGQLDKCLGQRMHRFHTAVGNGNTTQASQLLSTAAEDAFIWYLGLDKHGSRAMRGRAQVNIVTTDPAHSLPPTLAPTTPARALHRLASHRSGQAKRINHVGNRMPAICSKQTPETKRRNLVRLNLETLKVFRDNTDLGNPDQVHSMEQAMAHSENEPRNHFPFKKWLGKYRLRLIRFSHRLSTSPVRSTASILRILSSRPKIWQGPLTPQSRRASLMLEESTTDP